MRGLKIAITIVSLVALLTLVLGTVSAGPDTGRTTLLSVYKTGPDTVYHGENVTYTFYVTYWSSDGTAAQDVAVSDDHWGVATYIGGDTNFDNFLDTNENWTYQCYGVIPPHEENEEDPLVNMATATCVDIDGQPVDDATDNHTTDILHYSASLSIVKSGPATAHHGESVTYNFDVSLSIEDESEGPSPTHITGTDLVAANLTVYDDVYGYATYFSGDTDGDDLLDDNETWRFKVTGSIGPHSDSETDPIVNTATVNGDDYMGNTYTAASDSHSTNILHKAGRLSIEKTGPTSAFHGEAVTYYMNLTYTSDDNSPAQNIVVLDNTFGTCNYVSGDTDGDGLLDVNETWLYKVTGFIPAYDDDLDDPLQNIVSASGKDLDGDTVRSGSDSHFTDITHREGEFDIEKTGPATAYHGDTVTYWFNVSYSSNDSSPAQYITVYDDHYGYATYVSGDTDGDGYLDTNETWLYKVTGTIGSHDDSEEDPIHNEAFVDGFDLDWDYITAVYDGHYTDILHHAGTLYVEKTGPSTAYHGDNVTYSIYVQYSSPDNSPAQQVSVYDDHYGYASYISGDTDGDGLLDVNETWVFLVKGYIPSHSVGEEDPIINIATGTGYDLDGDPVTNGTGRHSTDIVHPEIKVEKTGPLTAVVGATINYTITVTNTGDTDLYIDSLNDSVHGDLSGYITNGVITMAEGYETFWYNELAGASPDPLVNNISVVANDGRGNTVSDWDTHTVDILRTGVMITKTAMNETHVGDNVRYTIKVTNTGDCDLYLTQLKDSLKGDLLSYLPDSVITVAENNNTFSYTLDVYSYPDPLTNTVTVVGYNEESMDQVRDTDSHTLDILRTGVYITKTGPLTAIGGQTVTYTVNITNNGEVDLWIASLTDSQAGDLRSMISGGVITMAEGYETFTYNVTVPPINGMFGNTIAVVGWNEEFMDQVSDADSHSVEIYSTGVMIEKNCSVNRSHVGDTVTYTVTVTNNGSVDLYIDSLEDSIAGNLSSYISDGVITVAEGSETFTYTVTVPFSPNPLINNVTVVGVNILGTAPVTATASVSLESYDDTKPFIWRTVGSPKFWWNGTLYIGRLTPINLSVYDHSPIVQFVGRIWYDGNWTSWIPYTGNFSLFRLGWHVVQVRAVDYYGNVGWYAFGVNVTDWTPIADAGPDMYLSELDPVAHHDGSNSTGLIFDLISWAWIFGDGSGIGYGEHVNHTYLADEGDYLVYLVVSNGRGQVDGDRMWVHVLNADPIVDAGEDVNTTEGHWVHFNGSWIDTPLDTHTYEWDLGDGTIVTNRLDFYHRYADDDNYTVTLTVWDNDGGVGNDTIMVNVANADPVARVYAYNNVTGGSIYGGLTVDEGEEFPFHYWHWDWGWTDVQTATLDMGDGTWPSTWTRVGYGYHYFMDNYTYYDDGVYWITLNVTDDDGGFGTFSYPITVLNVPPTVDAGEDQDVDEGELVWFQGSWTDPGRDTFTYHWDFGDGTNYTGWYRTSHRYADDGQYTVTFTVTDDDGGVGSDTLLVNVSNVAPSITVRYNQTLRENSGRWYSAVAYDPGLGDTFVFEWDMGDGTTYTDVNYTSSWYTRTSYVYHTYLDEGNYTVACTVTDDDGGSDTGNVFVDVWNYAPDLYVYGNQTIWEYRNASITVRFFDWGILDNHTIYIDFGDGTDMTTTNYTELSAYWGYLFLYHFYEDDGNYTITVKVWDEDGGEAMATFWVNVVNYEPLVWMWDGYYNYEGSVATFTGRFYDLGYADTHTFTWDFDDGTVVNSTTYTWYAMYYGEQTMNHTFMDNGVYNVTLTVTDDDGGSGSDYWIITIYNVAPEVEAGQDMRGSEGVSLFFSGSFVDPGLNDTHTISWDFGDGTWANGTLNPNHKYGDNGVYTVTLTVTDDDGGTDSDTLSVTIENLDPLCQLVGIINGQWYYYSDIVVDEGQFFDVYTYWYDYGWLDDLSLTLTFGDGRVESWTDDYIGYDLWNHSYGDDGTYTVTLTVTDDDGGSCNSFFNVTVENVPPAVEAGPDRVINEGDTVYFNGSFTDPGWLDTHTYHWDFGDGGEANGTLTPSHTYLDDGVYTVKLTVTDDDGGVGTDTLTVTVKNVPPTVEAGRDQTVDEGEIVYFIGSFTDPGVLDTHNITWDLGDGGMAYGALAVGHRYGDNGVYTVTLTVTDDDGGVGSDTLTITVLNVAPIAWVYPYGQPYVDNITVHEGQEFDYGAYCGDQGFLDTLNVTIDLGDGSTPIMWDDDYIGLYFFDHRYGDNGNYTITMTVIDDDGASTADYLYVEVLNVAPIVYAGTDMTVNEGAIVNFYGLMADPGWLDTHNFTWDMGDGNSLYGTLTPVWAYGDNGNYTVTLTVTDDDGGVGTDSLIVTVLNVPPTCTVYNMTGRGRAKNITVYEGQDVDVTSWYHDQGWADTLSIALDMGDGTTYYWSDDNFGIVKQSHAYGDDGTYTVTLTVTDDDGGSDTDTMIINVLNVAPSVDAGPDVTIGEGRSHHFNGTHTDPGWLDTHKYHWDFGDGAERNWSRTPWHRYLDDGVYTVTLTVTDDDGGVGTDTMTVTVLNAAPRAWWRNLTREAYEGDQVQFIVLIRDNGSLDDHTVVWDFGDGNGETQYYYDHHHGLIYANHTYGDNGRYNVTITVTDDDGAVGHNYRWITIHNVAPSVDAGRDQTVDEGHLIHFQGSYTDPGWLDTHNITWDLGDGNMAYGTLTPKHRYGDNGTYTVALTVTDDDGGVGSDTLTVTVLNVPPVCGIYPPGWYYVDEITVDEGEQFDYFLYYGDSGWLDLLTIKVDLGDGTPVITWTDYYFGFTTLNHTYGDDGNYTITLSVEDDDGGSASDTLLVNVRNVAPTADAGSDSNTTEGAIYRFRGAMSDPGWLDTHNFTWDFGDGNMGYGTLNPRHSYADNGTFTVTLTVTDDDGGVGTDTMILTVYNRPPTARVYNMTYPGSSSNITVLEGETFDFIVWFSDLGRDDTTTVEVDHDDGTITTWSDDNHGIYTMSHAYGDNGIYTITLTVTDDDGGVGTDTMIVNVRNVAPTVEAGPGQRSMEGYLLSFSGSFTDPGWLDTHTYLWDFGDGHTKTGTLTPKHRFMDDGVFTVTLTVTDDDGGAGSDTLTVGIINLDPFGALHGWNDTWPELDNITVGVGEEFEFLGWYYDPGHDDLLQISIDLGDGNWANWSDDYDGIFTMSHSYQAVGVYTIRMTIIDDDGGVDVAMMTVNVKND